MKTKTIIGAVCLIVGLALSCVSGARFEHRDSQERAAAAAQKNEERTTAAVEKEAARAGRLEAEIGELHERVDLIRLHLRLGRIAMEADRQDYGAAGERAAHFFDDLARMAHETPEGDQERAALQHVLAARDELIAGLATAQPAATERLKQLYLGLFDMDIASD